MDIVLCAKGNGVHPVPTEHEAALVGGKLSHCGGVHEDVTYYCVLGLQSVENDFESGGVFRVAGRGRASSSAASLEDQADVAVRHLDREGRIQLTAFGDRMKPARTAPIRPDIN